MNCPACGAAERQNRIGLLWNHPRVIYHCAACERCYGVPADGASAPALTDSQATVLRLTAAGLRNKEIAAKLDVSLRTVAIRCRAIMDKLGASNRAELIRKAIELGLAD